MAKGIKPLIHNWRGSEDIWPKELLWKDFDDLDKLLESPYESEKYRQHVEDNFSLEKQVAAISELFDSL